MEARPGFLLLCARTRGQEGARREPARWREAVGTQEWGGRCYWAEKVSLLLGSNRRGGFVFKLDSPAQWVWQG